MHLKLRTVMRRLYVKTKHIKAKAMLALARITFDKFKNSVRDSKIRFGDHEYEFLNSDISFLFSRGFA